MSEHNTDTYIRHKETYISKFFWFDVILVVITVKMNVNISTTNSSIDEYHYQYIVTRETLSMYKM